MTTGHMISMTRPSVSATTEPADHCSPGALTGGLGLFVQALLAFVAFSALIVKRYCEPAKTRRPWKTWCLDTSKQAVGAGFIHVVNVLASENLFRGDPCTWYIISFMLDSTLGLVIICVGLKVTLWIIIRRRWHLLVFGTYAPPTPCKSWFYQCLVYIGIIVVEKIVITVVTLFRFWKDVGEWILNRTTNADLELVMVMFIIPLIVNAIIFWIVDNFLKLHHPPQRTPSRHQQQQSKVKEREHVIPIPCDSLDRGYPSSDVKVVGRASRPQRRFKDETVPLVEVGPEDEAEFGVIVDGDRSGASAS